MPITFDSPSELQAFCQAFQLDIPPQRKQSEATPRVESLSNQARVILSELIAARQSFTVYEAVGLLTFRNPKLLRLSRTRLSMAFNYTLKMNYSHLRYKLVREPHAIRPMKCYLP